MAEKILKLEELQLYHNKLKETFSTKDELNNIEATLEEQIETKVAKDERITNSDILEILSK